MSIVVIWAIVLITVVVVLILADATGRPTAGGVGVFVIRTNILPVLHLGVHLLKGGIYEHLHTSGIIFS